MLSESICRLSVGWKVRSVLVSFRCQLGTAQSHLVGLLRSDWPVALSMRNCLNWWLAWVGLVHCGQRVLGCIRKLPEHASMVYTTSFCLKFLTWCLPMKDHVTWKWKSIPGFPLAKTWKSCFCSHCLLQQTEKWNRICSCISKGLPNGHASVRSGSEEGNKWSLRGWMIPPRWFGSGLEHFNLSTLLKFWSNASTLQKAVGKVQCLSATFSSKILWWHRVISESLSSGISYLKWGIKISLWMCEKASLSFSKTHTFAALALAVIPQLTVFEMCPLPSVPGGPMSQTQHALGTSVLNCLAI